MKRYHLRGVAAKLEKAESFQHSLDLLMEVCATWVTRKSPTPFKNLPPACSTAAGFR